MYQNLGLDFLQVSLLEIDGIATLAIGNEFEVVRWQAKVTFPINSQRYSNAGETSTSRRTKYTIPNAF